MARDDALSAKLTSLASEGPQLSFERLNPRELSALLGTAPVRSTNPIYRFVISEAEGESWDCVVFTLLLNGGSRTATRAEALGQAIAAGAETLFRHNPVLLIYDYVANRFMVVSGATLFGAFAAEATERAIPYSDTAYFSLTPSFERRTVTMYATISESDIWWCGDTNALTVPNLMVELKAVREQTATADVLAIEQAVQERIAGSPSASAVSEGVTPPVPIVPVAVFSHDRDEDDIQIDPRIWRMIMTAIRSSPAVILVGPPGTGKTALIRQAIKSFAQLEDFAANEMASAPLWATPDESWSARELVGGDTVVNGEIVFRPGWVLRAIGEARWLVLDEANRADLDRIFGGLMTWLAGGHVAVGAEGSSINARPVQLGWTDGLSRREETDEAVSYFAGAKWRLLGTYNALDAQRVFRFGNALGRRFVRIPIPAPAPSLFPNILAKFEPSLDPLAVQGIHNLYEAHFSSEATVLGPALFLAMSRYIAASDIAVEDGAVDAAKLREIIAEAYLVNVGTWLAQLEPSDRETLRGRTTALGALQEADWDWIETMLSSLA